jgi:hexosaminidase
VWNNVIGWGAEDLPYRLANAGYKVVLSCVGNNYFDLAYVKSPDEPGYYWGGYVDVDKPFYFIPYDYYRSTRENAAGDPADLAYFSGKERLTDYGRSNIAGIQGLLWGENIKNNESLEYMILPKLLGLAERAWAQDPQWAVEKDTDTARELYDQAWSVFVNTVGKRELPRLDCYHGGFAYRIPPAGAAIEDGKVFVNIQLPGFDLRYTSDGSEPTARSGKYTGPITGKGLIKIKAFNPLGRGGKTTTIENF